MFDTNESEDEVVLIPTDHQRAAPDPTNAINWAWCWVGAIVVVGVFVGRGFAELSNSKLGVLTVRLVFWAHFVLSCATFVWIQIRANPTARPQRIIGWAFLWLLGMYGLGIVGCLFLFAACFVASSRS